MALKVEISKLFQCGISSQKSNHFSVMFRSVKEFFSCYKKVFSRGIMCFVILCRKGFKICYPFVHLFCLKDKKQVNQIVYFYWRMCLTLLIVSQRIAESRGFCSGTPVCSHKEC